jgi:hypothetical protein
VFGYLIVYPAALILGLLVGLLLPRWGSSGPVVTLVVSGLPGAAFGIYEAFAYQDQVGLAQLVKEIVLPAGVICYALGVFGGRLGTDIRAKM